jgi:hypothetical protein
VPREDRGAGDRRQRLHAHRRGPDPQLGAAPVCRARHRRLRQKRHARAASRILRSGRRNIAVAALKALADEGAIDATLVRKAIGKYAIGADRPNPWDA